MTDPAPTPAPGAARPALLDCPRCRRTTDHYCAINDRVAVCPPCAESLRAELGTLTPEKLLKGAGAAALCAFAVCLAANVILASLGEKHGASSWIQGLTAVFMGTVVGRAARRYSMAGGLALQLATVAISIVAVLEMYAGLIYSMSVAKSGPLTALLFGILGSPLYSIAAVASGQYFILFWAFWAVYDPWRATRAVELKVDGPFPVTVTGPAAAPPGPPAPAPDDAKAAGLDFERPL